MSYKLEDEVRFIESLFYHGGHIVCLDPLTVRTYEGEEVPTNLNNIEHHTPQKFITSKGGHGHRRQLSNEQEGYNK